MEHLQNRKKDVWFGRNQNPSFHCIHPFWSILHQLCSSTPHLNHTDHHDKWSSSSFSIIMSSGTNEPLQPPTNSMTFSFPCPLPLPLRKKDSTLTIVSVYVFWSLSMGECGWLERRHTTTQRYIVRRHYSLSSKLILADLIELCTKSATIYLKLRIYNNKNESLTSK